MPQAGTGLSPELLLVGANSLRDFTGNVEKLVVRKAYMAPLKRAYLLAFGPGAVGMICAVPRPCQKLGRHTEKI